LGFWFGFSLRGLALCRVCMIAPSFVSGWWAFSSVSLSVNQLSILSIGFIYWSILSINTINRGVCTNEPYSS
jgi:hypothetical protein